MIILGIGLTIVVVVAWVLVGIVSIVFVLKVLYRLSVFLAWIIGVFKALTDDY